MNHRIINMNRTVHQNRMKQIVRLNQMNQVIKVDLRELKTKAYFYSIVSGNHLIIPDLIRNYLYLSFFIIEQRKKRKKRPKRRKLFMRFTDMNKDLREALRVTKNLYLISSLL
jgi:hypothetical protein